MQLTRKTLLALALTLTWLPACDKGEDKPAKADDKAAKADAKTDAKTDAKPADADAHAGHGDAHGTDAAADETAEVAADGKVEINVDATGYHPATIAAPAKAKITLAFKRTTESGCGEELVIKDLDIKKTLPVGEVVEIPVEVPESGELGFACGMDMYKGKVVPKA